MSKINIPQNASATDKLKALTHHLLDKLTALRSHFGSLAHSGARGTLEANQKNEDDKTLLAAVHESADTGNPIVMPIQTYRDPVEPLQYPTINAGTPVLPDENTTAKTNTPPPDESSSSSSSSDSSDSALYSDSAFDEPQDAPGSSSSSSSDSSENSHA